MLYNLLDNNSIKIKTVKFALYYPRTRSADFTKKLSILFAEYRISSRSLILAEDFKSMVSCDVIWQQDRK